MSCTLGSTILEAKRLGDEVVVLAESGKGRKVTGRERDGGGEGGRGKKSLKVFLKVYPPQTGVS